MCTKNKAVNFSAQKFSKNFGHGDLKESQLWTDFKKTCRQTLYELV